VAGLLVTTEAMVAEAPKKQAPMPRCRPAVAAWAEWISDPDQRYTNSMQGAAKSRAFFHSGSLLLPVGTWRRAAAATRAHPASAIAQARPCRLPASIGSLASARAHLAHDELLAAPHLAIGFEERGDRCTVYSSSVSPCERLLVSMEFRRSASTRWRSA